MHRVLSPHSSAGGTACEAEMGHRPREPGQAPRPVPDPPPAHSASNLSRRRFDRGRNPHGLAVFGDGAAGDVDALLLQHLDDALVGQRIARPARRRSVRGCGSAPTRPNARRRRAPPAIDEVKKYFSSNRPRGVAMYLLVVTRLTVLSCMPIASAMSRRISGRSGCTPWRKKRPAGARSRSRP